MYLCLRIGEVLFAAKKNTKKHVNTFQRLHRVQTLSNFPFCLEKAEIRDNVYI